MFGVWCLEFGACLELGAWSLVIQYMQIIKQVSQMAAQAQGMRRGSRRIGFVPTMGALHEGHASLMRAARRETDFVVASIFVNPLQFGPTEDYKRYPRTLSEDLEICRGEGVDVVLTPSAEEMYPKNFSSVVEVRAFSEVWEGKARPGHFRGVTTVVAKLLHLVQPTTLYLGQKDYQQALLLQRMIQELGWTLTVRVMPTVREPDGLAVSSRNRALSAAQRRQAPMIIQALRLARERIEGGARAVGPLVALMQRTIREATLARVDYVAVVEASTLKPLATLTRGRRVALLAAARFGSTRLIDNALVDVP